MRGSQTLFISGIPKEYNWKRLKDLARGFGVDPQWTELIPSKYETDKLSGYTSVKDAGAAEKLYGCFTSTECTGAELRVHYWDTPQTPAMGKAKFVRCNCRDLGSDCVVNSPPPVAGRVYGTKRSSLPPVTTGVSSGMRAPALQEGPRYETPMTLLSNYTTTSSPTQTYYHQNPGAYPMAPSPDAIPRQTGGLRSMTRIETNSGVSVNISGGAYRTEARSIFVSNLPYTVQKSELENLLRMYGPLVRCEVRPHKRTQGYTQGTAIVEFASRDQAYHAIEGLDGYTWNGRQIGARFDRDTVRSDPINESEPIVVNGSGRD